MQQHQLNATLFDNFLFSYYQNNTTQVTSWEAPPGWPSAACVQPPPAPLQQTSQQSYVAPAPSSDIVQDAQKAAAAFESFASKVLSDGAASSDCSSFVPASESIRSASGNCLQLLDGLISKSNLNIAELLDRQTDLTSTIKNLELELATITSDIQTATQAEDFDRAEALTCDEARVTRTVLQRKADLDVVNTELSAAQSKIGVILSLKVQVSEALVRYTTSCASAALSKGNSTVSELQSQIEITAARMNSKARQASALSDSLDLEQKRLEDDEKVVNDKIYDMTREDQEKFSRLQAAQGVVAQEIAELERQLRLKISEKSQIEIDIQALNSSFDVVKQDFAPQFAAFRVRHESHEASKQQLDAMRLEVQSKESDMVEQTAVCDGAKSTLASVSLRLNKMVAAASELLAAQKSFVDSYAEEQREKAKEAEQELTERREMQAVLQRVQQCSASFEAVSASLLSLQAEVQGIVSEVLRIDIRVPELESQKKAAVAAKKFKEAGLFSTESKDLLTRKEELLARKTQLNAEEDVKKQDVVRLEADQANMCIEKEKLSQVHDTQRLQRLIRRHKLRAAAQARHIASEDFAAAESLQKECSNLAEEIKIISSKLGVPMVDLQEHLPLPNHSASQPSQDTAGAELVCLSDQPDGSLHQAGVDGHAVAAAAAEQAAVEVEAESRVEVEVLNTDDAAAKLQGLKEMASKLDDQLDQLVSQEKFEEADELNRQLDDVRRKINTLEDQLQSHGLNLSQSESQPSASSLDMNHQPSLVFEGSPSSVINAADAVAQHEALKESFTKLSNELDQLVLQDKFEEAAELDRQLEGVKRQIKALEAEMQSHGMNLSESGSQTGAAVQWEQDHHSEKSGTSGFGRTFFSDSVPGDGRTIRSFCSGASTGSNDEDDRGSKDGAGTVYTIGSLYSQAHAEGGGEDAGTLSRLLRSLLSFSCLMLWCVFAGSMWERASATESRGGRESQGGDNDQEAGPSIQVFTMNSYFSNLFFVSSR
jgi:hypothetical protein